MLRTDRQRDRNTLLKKHFLLRIFYPPPSCSHYFFTASPTLIEVTVVLWKLLTWKVVIFEEKKIPVDIMRRIQNNFILKLIVNPRWPDQKRSFPVTPTSLLHILRASNLINAYFEVFNAYSFLIPIHQSFCMEAGFSILNESGKYFDCYFYEIFSFRRFVCKNFLEINLFLFINYNSV